MALELKSLISVLGWTVQGDLGGWTMYTSHRRSLVFYAKAPPLDPPSYGQSLIRLNFSNAAAQWSILTDEERMSWREANQLIQSRITPYNLWLAVALKDTDQRFESLQRTTQLPLKKPWT